MWLEALPLTPNGKLDRKALPAPDGQALASAAYEAPQGPVEEALAAIWAEALGLERVGRRDNFFELGGHSLIAVRVLERMRRAELRADVRAFFATPTLKDLAAAVGEGSGWVEVPPNLIPDGCEAITPQMLPLVALSPAEIAAVVATAPGGAANVQDIYPLAPLQEGILFHHLLAKEGDPYLLWSLVSFPDRATVEAAVVALNAVIARHDILRTGVVWEGLAEPVQVVWRRAAVELEEVVLDPADGDVGEQLKARFDPRRFRLDVRKAPMMRLMAAHDPAHGRWIGMSLLHHLAGDHSTLEMMQAEIGAHLSGEAGRLPPPLPFRNFVAQARLGVSREEHETFFREMLGDVTEPTAPFGLTNVQGDGSGIGEAREAVAPSCRRGLRTQARALGVSAASLFHVAWNQVVALTSGREDPVFGTVLFGRMQGGEGADQVLGMFMNTLPVRLRLADVGAAAGVRRAHRLLSELMRHEHAPLAQAQRCSGVGAQTPLFSALLNYRHSAARQDARRGASRAGIGALGGEERTNYPVTLSVDDLGDGFELTRRWRRRQMRRRCAR